ncbi:MAG: hypothetical protein RLZZ418_517, partial [Pseudomonadota bacterium]
HSKEYSVAIRLEKKFSKNNFFKKIFNPLTPNKGVLFLNIF